MPIEIFVDHTGPMTRTVTDNALLLEVIAGPDGYDPRQYAPGSSHIPTAWSAASMACGSPWYGKGLVAESEPAVDEKVRQGAAVQAAGRHGRRGLDPHAPARPDIWTPIGVEGITQTMMYGDGYGLSRPDLYVTSLIDKLARMDCARQRALGDDQGDYHPWCLPQEISRQPLLRQSNQ